MKYEIKENQTYQSKEIYFDEKPSEATRAALKALKFRWNGARGIWYGFATVEQIESAINAGSRLEAAKTETQPAKAKKEKSARKIAPLWERVQVADIPQHDTGLDNKIIAAELRAHLRERFPEVKFSITSDYLSVNCYIVAAPYGRERIYKDPRTGEPDAYGYYKNSPALEAVQHYGRTLANSYNYDNSDSMTDYFDVGFYGGYFEISGNFKQTEPTPEQSADIADFEAKKAAADEAESAANLARARAEMEERERAAKEYEETKRKEAETAEKIKNDIIIEDLDEPQQFAFLGMIEASGKQENINEVDEDITPIDEHGNPRKRQHRDAVISRKITFKTPDIFGAFCQMFLHDFEFLAGFGSTACEDPRVKSYDDYIKLTREQAQTVHTFTTDAIAVYYPAGVPQFVIDPQGYGYARYILRFDIADGETPEKMPAAEYLKKCRETAESLPPFYIPAPLSEQIETANIKAGETVSIIQIDPWICCAQHINGTITEATAITWAQYQDAARVEIIPSGKRKPITLHTHSGSAFAMYRGTLPEVPQSLKYKQFGENMRISLFAGEYADDYIKNAIDYYHKIGLDPIINTIPR